MPTRKGRVITIDRAGSKSIIFTGIEAYLLSLLCDAYKKSPSRTIAIFFSFSFYKEYITAQRYVYN